MDAKKIDRINELYHKSKSVGLTEKEKSEQAALRREYLAAIRGSLRNNLNNISIEMCIRDRMKHPVIWWQERPE